ncbi:MAG: hypothetical protein LBR85_04955, partial [Oscillospiraceae bacterium]|nr:hypothetical protein [Oscillospiraceae bacterium]
YARLLGAGVYLHPHSLQNIRWLPALVYPFLCCPFSLPHFGHFTSFFSMTYLYHTRTVFVHSRPAAYEKRKTLRN